MVQPCTMGEEREDPGVGGREVAGEAGQKAPGNTRTGSWYRQHQYSVLRVLSAGHCVLVCGGRNFTWRDRGRR